jgi:hypothetical protein
MAEAVPFQSRICATGTSGLSEIFFAASQRDFDNKSDPNSETTTLNSFLHSIFDAFWCIFGAIWRHFAALSAR